MKQNQIILIVAAVALGIPILSCGGCLMLGAVIGLVSPTNSSEPVGTHRDARNSPKATKTKPIVAAQNLNVLRRQFLNTLAAIGVDSTWIAAVNVVTATDLELTVSNAWHYQPKQIRLQAAQTLWETWARVASPNELDLAHLKLLDMSGNNVGGSGMFAGSIVSVAD